MRRNWGDIVERAASTAVMTFVGVWAAMEFKWDVVTLKATAIGTVISIAKNLAVQGSVTQTPREPMPVEERVEESK